MPIRIGSTPIVGIKQGAVDVLSVRQGSALVWSKSTLYDGFDANGDLGANWAEESSSGAYKAGVVNNACRLAIPDGLIDAAFMTSAFRWSASVCDGDDGYLEVQLGSRGDSDAGFYSSAWRRAPDAGGFASGVGLQFAGSQVAIVGRVSSVSTVRAACGACDAGEAFRLIQAGNVHSLYRNGDFAGEWNDSGATVPKGSGLRSMVVEVSGAKDFFGPRRFSPSFDNIECG
jgi:hypothetical protein